MNPVAVVSFWPDSFLFTSSSIPRFKLHRGKDVFEEAKQTERKSIRTLHRWWTEFYRRISCLNRTWLGRPFQKKLASCFGVPTLNVQGHGKKHLKEQLWLAFVQLGVLWSASIPPLAGNGDSLKRQTGFGTDLPNDLKVLKHPLGS